MARQILYLHWKAVWMGLIPLAIAAFGLPLLAVQGLARPEGLADGFWASLILQRVQVTVGLFPVLAGVTGIVLALTTWSWDHQLNHVYALSLPLPRWRYVVLKFGAGLILALLPAAAVLAGGVAAGASVDLPPLLHAYPLAITARFFLSSVLVFAILFAMAAGSIRTTVILLTVWAVFLLLGGSTIQLAGSLMNRPDLASFDFVGWVGEVLTNRGGPFHILTGNWALIDV